MFKSVEDLQSLGRDQVAAATASAAAVTRGVQQIATEASAYASRSFEDGSAAAARLMGVRSLEGAMEVQADYASSAFEGLMAQASRIGSLMAMVTRDAAQPFGFGGKGSGGR